MYSDKPVYTPCIVANRQNPRMHAAYQVLHGAGTHLLANHDRWALFRPTTVDARWTTRKGIHLDLNPWMWLADGEFTGKRLLFENNLCTRSMGLRVRTRRSPRRAYLLSRRRLMCP